MGKKKDETDTQEKTVTEKLQQRFHPDNIEWLIVNRGRSHNGGVYAYATPFIKKESGESHLDQVVGVENWETNYDMPDPHGRIKYWIRFRMSADSEWIYRHDGASIDLNAKGNFAKDAFEIALTFAEKRCLQKVGIGRYLRLVPQTKVETSNEYQAGWTKHTFKIKKGDKYQSISFYWKTPRLPDFALPEGFSYSSPDDPDQDSTGTEQEKKTRMLATDEQWEKIDIYLKHMSPEAHENYLPKVYNETMGGEEAESEDEIVYQKKQISVEYANKFLKMCQKGLGKIVDGVPEKTESKPTPSKKKEESAPGDNQDTKSRQEQAKTKEKPTTEKPSPSDGQLPFDGKDAAKRTYGSPE